MSPADLLCRLSPFRRLSNAAQTPPFSLLNPSPRPCLRRLHFFDPFFARLQLYPYLPVNLVLILIVYAFNHTFFSNLFHLPLIFIIYVLYLHFSLKFAEFWYLRSLNHAHTSPLLRTPCDAKDGIPEPSFFPFGSSRPHLFAYDKSFPLPLSPLCPFA